MTTRAPLSWEAEQLRQDYLDAIRLRVRLILASGVVLLLVGFAAGVLTGRRTRRATR